jgi:hypothetical protein
MKPVEEIRGCWAGDALEHAVFRLQHRDGAPFAAHDRGDFETDIAAAHDHDALRVVDRWS